MSDIDRHVRRRRWRTILLAVLAGRAVGAGKHVDRWRGRA
jgi:hypothetical protein